MLIFKKLQEILNFSERKRETEWIKKERKGERQRHTDTKTHRHAASQTHRHTDTQTHRHKDIFGSCAFNDSGLGLGELNDPLILPLWGSPKPIL